MKSSEWDESKHISTKHRHFQEHNNVSWWIFFQKLIQNFEKICSNITTVTNAITCAL